jgi:hypothetical protein
VVKKATRDASLFCQTWVATPGRLVFDGEMRSPLSFGGENVAAPASNVRLVIDLPAEAVLSRTSAETTIRAWVFGRILSSSNERGTLTLEIKPIAILKDHEHQH